MNPSPSGGGLSSVRNRGVHEQHVRGRVVEHRAVFDGGERDPEVRGAHEADIVVADDRAAAPGPRDRVVEHVSGHDGHFDESEWLL